MTVDVSLLELTPKINSSSHVHNIRCDQSQLPAQFEIIIFANPFVDNNKVSHWATQQLEAAHN